MRHCSWCGTEFSVERKGERYCSQLCRELSSVESEQRRKKQAKLERRRAAKKRCIQCGAVLSMYGEGDTCATCIDPKSIHSILKQLNKKVKT
jgi:predicted nucleic acid-binding Zn ribbon protein